MIHFASPLRDRRAATVVVGVVAGLVFANSLANGFAYDDVVVVANNPGIQSLATLPAAVFKAPYWPGTAGGESGLWRPVTTALLGLEYVVGGGSPLMFHTMNVVAHIAASVLVLLLCVELMSLPAALAAGLIFAVHPVHVEAIANVVGLSEPVSTVFVLAACLVHLRGGNRSGWRQALAIGGLYALGFGAKESAVTLPGLIFLLDAVRRRLTLRDVPAYLGDRWRAYLVMLGVAGVVLWGRVLVLGSVASPLPPAGADVLTEIPRIWTLAEVWTHYVRLWIFPFDLSVDYAPDVIPISFGWHATNVVGVMLALGILAITLYAWRRDTTEHGVDTSRLAGFGVVWFLVAISPISNVFFISGVLLAERTLYLPSVGLAAAMGWLIVRFARERPRGAWVLLTAVVLLGSARTWTRTPTWKDSESVMMTVLEEHPESGVGWLALGRRLVAQGRHSDALVAFRYAIGPFNSGYKESTEIASYLMAMNRSESARFFLMRAWREYPERYLAPGLLAAANLNTGRPHEAATAARAAAAIRPDNPSVHHLLAQSLSRLGAWEEAVVARRAAIRTGYSDRSGTWLLLAADHLSLGDTLAAMAARDSAEVRAGTDAERTAARKWLAGLCGSSPGGGC